MAATHTPAPLHKADLPSCTLTQLRDLTWTYYNDPQSLQLVLNEYARRGVDPYGA